MTDDPAMFAIVPLPPLGPAREALLRDAIAYGGGGELLRKFFACEEVERDLANQQAQTAEAASRIAEVGAHLMDMTEALTVRADKQRRLDAKRRADQERRAQEDAVRAEQEQILQYLATHPEPGSPAAELDDTHHPGGDLHALEPPDKEHLDPEAQTDAGGEDLDESQGIGGATYPEPDPEELGGPKDPKQVPQPVAVSLW